MSLDPQVYSLDPPFEYPMANHDPAEVAFQEYEFEQWTEAPERWSPCVDLDQLAKRPDLEVQWYVPDFIPAGSKTIISAEPKCGKTLLLFHMLKAVVTGGKFLGRTCPPQRVLYFSEITEQELKHQLKEVPGLLGNKNFYVLLPEEAPVNMRTWQDTIEFAERMLVATKAKILVFDTFGSWAKLPPNGENDSSTIQNTVNQLNHLLKNRYLSIVLTHHNRKPSEGAAKQNISLNAARGSSAFVGAAGHLILMSAPERGSTRRDIGIYGRYVNGVEKTIVLEKDGYHEQQGLTFGGGR
jgi:RecA-family ATPase